LPLSFFAFLFPSMARIERAFTSAIPGGRRCRNGGLKSCLPALLGAMLLAGLPAGATGTATTTTLAVTSGGSAVTTVTSGSVVTLTATVMAGTTPVNPGQVKFCDAKAAHCEDIHIVGTAQLTKAGTATFKFRPGVGSHSYKAVFVGTKSNAGSTSGTAVLTVTHTGLYPTETAIAQSGGPGNYTLTATVGGTGPLVPTGTVSFLDTSNGNALLGSATLGAGAGINFLNSSNPATTGAGPRAIAVGDFNGDGVPDLATANDTDFGTVTILLGNGDGTFTATATSPVTEVYAYSIAVGDFNGDGIPDLAVANLCGDDPTCRSAGTVTILLGNGDGTFTATATSPATGNSPVSIAVGDFNGDGILDLAVANNDSNSVTVLLGNGDGTFTATATSPATGQNPFSIAVGDFNGDGIPDLAVVNQCGNNGPCAPNGTVTVLLGNGDGTFTATAVNPATGSQPRSIVAADFNGDGIPDLAVVNFGPYGDPVGSVTILLGNGDGTFAATAAIPTSGKPFYIAVGDLNGDGIPDLAVSITCSTVAACESSDGTVTVLLGNGDGTFTPATATPATTGYCCLSIAVGDFNGDGIPDLAVTDADNDTVEVLLTETQTATASGGVAVAPGAHQVVASYPGDSDYDASTSLPTVLDLALAALTSPTPGSVLPGSSVTFTWTAGIGPTEYQLCLGTARASCNLLDEDETNGTSLSVTGLPTYGQTLYAALGSLIGGVWQWADYTYTEAGTPLAALTSPIPGSVLTGSSVTFTWSAGFGVTAYQFWLGTTGIGSSNLYNSGVTTATSASVTGLPTNGQTVYAQLGSLLGGVWQYANYTYTEHGTPAALTSPTPGSTLPSSSVTFSWSAGVGVTEYQLWLGTVGAGSSNLYNSGETTATSASVTGLPTYGRTVYAQLWSLLDDAWVSAYYTYTEATPAALTSPTPGSTLPGSSVTFAWSAGTGPTAYQLWLGTTGVGSQNLFNSGSTTATSASVTGLPTYGQKVYATLGSLIGGVWQYANYTYTEAGTPAPAPITSPQPGSTLPGSSATFAWTGGTGPTAYQLWLGTTGVGSQNLFDSGATKATTVTVSGLPTNGVTLFVRLWSLMNGTWQSIDYLYTESGTLAPAALTSPAPGSTLTGSSVTFTWTGGSGPAAYQLWLGTTRVGSQNLYDSGATTATSETVTVPANGVTVFARLWSEIDGSWRSADYIYTEAGTPVPAALTSPQPGSTLTGSSVAFTWTGGSGPAAYELWLGTAGAGSHNLYDSGSTTATSETVTVPANGVTVFARLYQLINGTWRSSDYTYTESGTLAPPALTSPQPGSTLTGSSVTFTWTAGSGPAQYALWLGTTGVGSSNLYYSGSTKATTVTVSDLPTNGVTVYARLWWEIDGSWRSADYTYTAYTAP
jgi:hypothetical protein